MTEQEYADIAAACDRLLRAPGTNLARLAIPLLHFLNEHPSVLAQYASLLTERSAGKFAHIPKALIRAARSLTRSLFAPHLAIQQAPIDVVIVSHLLKPEQLLQRDDFYFGALQSRLQDAGVSSLLVLINHLTVAPIQQHSAPFSNARLVLPGTVSPTTEANIWQQCSNAARALRREAAGAHNPADAKLAMLASRQALSASAVINLRMHAALAAVCQAINPKMVITTYEGTVAERLIWHAARTAKRRPLCVGYQHATVLERAHAIRRPVAAPGIDCDPDIVLTLGEITHAALAASPELKAVRFIHYGSHRRATLPVLPQPQHRPRRCLVLPDASDQECVTLFDFALASARHRPDISFALRPHPMVDTQSLLRRHPQLQKLPPNVALSVDAPLEQEFAQTRYCLYRGSSAALYAVRAGIKPYYLARPGELPIDCLFALNDWREMVTSPEDLSNRMSLGDACTDSGAAARSVDVCERYVSPIRPAAINELLAMVAR
ncbi:MAG TPA: hypothetical protein VGD63_19840 [Steroidobacteraceae bacterium]